MKERKIYLDYLRVMATVFVLCNHTVGLAASLVSTDCMVYYILKIFEYILWTANPLFFMISGALLLPVRNERTAVFFRKRFSKVAIPMVVCYVLYVCAKEGLVWLRPDHWLPMLQRIVSGAPVEAPHFWLIYIFITLYLLTPFLRWIVSHIPDEVFGGVIVVIFLVSILDTYLPLFGLDAHLTPIADSFAGVFLLGYFLAEKCSVWVERFFYAGGVISVLISCIWLVRTPDSANYIYQSSPTMMLYTGAVFLGVKRLADGRGKECRAVQLISRYSYTILLLHWGVLHVAVKQILHVDVLSRGIVGGCLLMILLTLLISLVGAIIFEHTVMKVIDMLLKAAGICLLTLKRNFKKIFMK